MRTRSAQALLAPCPVPDYIAGEAYHEHRPSSRRHRSPLGESETFALPREQAREKAREIFRRFPKAAYMTEIESWRELPGDRIEFTMRRLPSAD